MVTTPIRYLFIAVLAACLAGEAGAQSDVDRGRAVYERLCAFCHGKDGAGDGPAAQFLNPPPRDFTLGLYKWKTSPFDEYAPTDADLDRMISGMKAHGAIDGWDGMSGTSMPGWSDVLGKDEITAVGAYLKSLAGYEKAARGPIDLSGKVKADKEGLERGRAVFKENCSECHGARGRGNATKKLKDDWGARTWPRDLTEGWTFRAGSTPEDIYARVTVGIAGTQMPSFADPASKKALTEPQRWDVANYAASLSEPGRTPGVDAVLTAFKAGRLPGGVRDGLWDKTAPTGFYLFPQIFTGEKAYAPSISSIAVRALYDDDGIAFLLEWDDPTNSMPWDAKALEIADGEVFPDSVAMQFPQGPSKPADKPYFGMGSKRPVVIWQWKSPESAGAGQLSRVIDARGPRSVTVREAAGALSVEGEYDEGRWRVMMKGPRKATDRDPAFMDDGFVPVAFALWDGSNGDKGSRHLMTGWQWVVLEKQKEGSAYLWPAVAGLLVLCAEALWLISARKRD